MQSPPSKEHHRLVPRCPAHPLAAVSPSRYNCHPDSKSHHFLDHLCYVNPPKHTRIVSGLSMCICGCVLFLLLSTMCVQFICVAVWNCKSCLLIADAASRRMNVSKCILPTFDGLSVMSFGGLSWTLAEPLHLHPQLSWIMENCFPKRLCHSPLHQLVVQSSSCSTSSPVLPVFCQKVLLYLAVWCLFAFFGFLMGLSTISCIGIWAWISFVYELLGFCPFL